jgi:hypothetical protein
LSKDEWCSRQPVCTELVFDSKNDYLPPFEIAEKSISAFMQRLSTKSVPFWEKIAKPFSRLCSLYERERVVKIKKLVPLSLSSDAIWQYCICLRCPSFPPLAGVVSDVVHFLSFSLSLSLTLACSLPRSD